MNEIIKYSDNQVKEQVQLVFSVARRTVDESIKLGEMLVQKKQEKKHGEWLPFLKEIDLSQSTAQRLMTAFKERDNYIEGMTFCELVKETKLPNLGNLEYNKTNIENPIQPVNDISGPELEIEDTEEKPYYENKEIAITSNMAKNTGSTNA